MNLLAGTLYDPTGGAAVSKATTALLAMTALDTTNLRLTFTVPLSGRAYVRVSGGALHGAATYPAILVGILNGATVTARMQPIVTVNGAASATTPGQVFAEFVVTGLTPGASLTWDLAYGVEAIVAATGWKYGGPNNNTTAGDAFGGISFTIWDPAPIYLPTVMPTATVQANQSTSLTNEATIAGYIDTEVAAIKAKTDSLTFTTAGKVDVTMNAAGDFPQACADKAWSTAARTLTASLDPTAAQIRAEMDSNSTKLANLDATTSSRASAANLATVAGYIDTEVASILSDTTTLTGRLTAGRATNLDNLDAAISTRSTYAGADTSGTTTLLSRVPSTVPVATDYTAARAAKLDNLDATISSRGTSTYAGGAVASVTGAVGSVAAGGITAASFGASAIDAAALATDAGQEIADRLLTRALGGGADTGRTVRQALAATRNKVEIVGTTLSVYAEDDTTVLYTATITTAPGDPLASIDPA